MTLNRVKLQWADNVWSSQCWVLLTKVLCKICHPLAKGQSTPDYIFTIEDYSKILFHAQLQLNEKSYDQFLEFTLWSGSHGKWWKLGESNKSFFLYALEFLPKPKPCRNLYIF